MVSREISEKAIGIFGIAFGFILYIIFIFVLHTAIIARFFTKTIVSGGMTESIVMLSGPYYEWLIAGSIPVFIMIGYYLVHGYHSGGEVKRNDLRLLAITVIGFMLWFLVLVALSTLKMVIPYEFNLIGGYVWYIIFIYVLIKYINYNFN
ncbi:hypothetical protein [Methanocella conradii]|uniref:hypothetical protein n=1 Tax=Methanocella conradii TaxID=1175444 RepID=UPI00157E240E|nr:hypothetical protein [Methanocella conradii]